MCVSVEVLTMTPFLPAHCASTWPYAIAHVHNTHAGREKARRDDLAEMAHIYDMGVPHAVDKFDPSKPWSQSLRPPPRKIQLSQYQTEMINYQRMLLRKNIWYYRDRMNNARCVQRRIHTQ